MDTTIDHDTQAALDALDARVTALEGGPVDPKEEETEEVEETEEDRY